MKKSLIISLSIFTSLFSFTNESMADFFSLESEMDRKIKEEFIKSIDDEYIAKEKERAINNLKNIEKDYMLVKREFDELVLKGDRKQINKKDIQLIHFQLNNKVTSTIDKVGRYPSQFTLPVVRNYYTAKRDYYIFQLYYIQDVVDTMKVTRKINSKMKEEILRTYSSKFTYINAEAASKELDFNNL